MMRARTQWSASLAGIALIAIATLPSYGQDSDDSAGASKRHQQVTEQAGGTNSLASLETRAENTIQTFKQKDPTLQTFFRNSAGYAVFPSVGEGAFIVGGAHGKGLVYRKGEAIGETTISKGTIGAQAGAESYSELIFFQTPQALQQFKQGNFQFAVGLNAVVANAGVGAQTNYRDGVAVFTASRTGLMAKAAIGGQKFTYQPLAMGGGGLNGQGGASYGSSTNGSNLSGGR